LAPLEEKASRLYNRVAKLTEQRDKLILSKGKGIDWAWLLNTYPESTAKHNFRREQFRKLGLMDPFGHWMDTKQTAVKIGLDKQNSKTFHWRNDKQLKAVQKLLPFIKVGDKGCKRIDIFEHTLSASGSYWLEFYEAPRDVKSNPKGYEYCIQLGQSFGKPVRFNTIEEAFEYVRKHHWYESSDPDDYEHDHDCDCSHCED
jgi:hypothetical protein